MSARRTFLAAAAALLVLAGRADAQAAPGCRGTFSETSSLTLRHPLTGEPVEIPGYPVITSVQPGSPAERAGMRAGDRVLTQDGRDLVDSAPPPASAGDTVRLVVQREGAERTLTLVLGRWDPPQAAPGVNRACVPVD